MRLGEMLDQWEVYRQYHGLSKGETDKKSPATPSGKTTFGCVFPTGI